MEENILLSHGSGGQRMDELINNLFIKYFDNPILNKKSDSAILQDCSKNLAFTTDSYVVDPIFFPGGDIGKLAVCGTVNDLAVSGAVPMYLSLSFIIEEGFAINQLEKIVKSISIEANKANIKIATGDTKVVNKGKCDKIFINTTGIGYLNEKNTSISNGSKINIGDKIIINGPIAEHGIAILASREENSFKTNIKSDCASLHSLIQSVLSTSNSIHFMRDATRGGLASVLCEIADIAKAGILLEENNIPVNEEVQGICELLGFDPLYIANEGKVVIIAGNNDAGQILETLKKHPLGKESRIIGEVTGNHSGKVILNTEIGGKRIINKLVGEQLPRIC